MFGLTLERLRKGEKRKIKRKSERKLRRRVKEEENGEDLELTVQDPSNSLKS